jgi:uncharacterized protein YndB with AHSA1/START domain
METKEKTTIKVQTVIDAPVEKVWKLWTTPEHIKCWNNASEDWHTPEAQNDLRVGGKFLYRMEAKDGSTGFDFGGVYKTVKVNERIEYVLDDGRKVRVDFTKAGSGTRVVETFDPESVNSIEMQQTGWQAILDNFKKYVEGNHWLREIEQYITSLNLKDMENFKEEFKVKSEEVIGKVKELLHEGNVRKLIIKDEDGKVYLEIPVTFGLIGAILAPTLAAVGALAAMVANLKIEVVRTDAPEKPPSPENKA